MVIVRRGSRVCVCLSLGGGLSISNRFGGDDFFVSNGRLQELFIYDHDLTQASTFMHELGHNLDLLHYGDQFTCPHADDLIENHIDGKGCPDYVSIMSYHYQLAHISWPNSWNGLPNYGPHPGGWNDWDNIDLDITTHTD